MQTIDPDDPVTAYKGLDFTLNGDREEASFIVMGCWNSYCMNVAKGSFIQSSYQRLVANMISQSQKTIKAKYIIGAGDNHYNHPLGVEKTIADILDVGTKCFNKINIPMFMSIGNHDVASRDILAEQLKKTYDNSDITTPDIRFSSNWILPSAYYHINHTLDGAEIDFCYVETSLFGGRHFLTESTKTQLCKDMLIWLDSILTQCKGIKCLVGHHPIFAVGHADPDKPVINTDLMSLYRLAIKHKIHFYFCADEHNSQYIYDDMNDIHHIVSGGTAPGSGGDIAVIHDYPSDYHRPDIKIAYIEEDMSYQVRSIFTFSGPSFIHFNINKDEIDFRIKGICDNILHNNKEDIKNMCDTGYAGRLDILKDNVALNIKDFFVKKIPRRHNLMFMIDCASYKHVQDAALLKDKHKKLYTSLDNINRDVKKHKEEYKKINLMIISEKGKEIFMI
jgi:hypothetical protein